MLDFMIKETTKDDLDHVRELWNSGEVMFYVGFPNGIGITTEKLEEWLKGIHQAALTKHYSIYTKVLGYCGEAYYSVDTEHDLATLDIKLLPKAQGKGIASRALSHAINQVFQGNLATKAYVDPHKENVNAWKLYRKLGFIEKKRPDFLEAGDTYLELSIENWNMPMDESS